MKLGRRRPVARGPRLSLKNYFNLSVLPSPPTSLDLTAPAMPSLGNVYLNNELGDCTIAGLAHIIGVATGNAGSCVTFTDDQITAMYSKCGGYVPGNPATDQGCDELTVLNTWQQSGIAGGHQIAGWVAVDPTNPVEYRTAAWLFENLYFGIELPDAWISPFPSSSGFVWDVAGAANPANGHCVITPGKFDSSGMGIDSWGLIGSITDAAVHEYCAASDGGALYCVLTLESIIAATGKAPSGYDWTQLVADIDAMGGSIAAPVPAPAPATGLATEQAVLDALASAFSYSIMTKQQAVLQAQAAVRALSWPASLKKP